MHIVTEDKSNNHPNDDMPPHSGPRHTGRTPTPYEARNWATMAGAVLRELVRIHRVNQQMTDALKGQNARSDQAGSLGVQRVCIGEALYDAVQLQEELDAYAAANCGGGVVVLPAEDG